MKSKQYIFYILLGVGIGIILTSFIFILNPNIKYKEYSNSEIIDKARELGMVSVKDNIERNSEEEDKDTEEINSEYVFTIKNNETLSGIATNLSKIGIIEEKDEFIQFVKDHKMETKLLPGTYKLKKNLSYTTILKILTTKSS